VKYDSSFFRVLGKITDCFYLSTLWIVGCIPVVTAGASTEALLYTANKVLRDDRGYIARDFFGEFKKSFRRMTIVWVIQAAVLMVLLFNRWICLQGLQQGSVLGLLYYPLVFLVWYCVIWMIMTAAYASRYELDWKNTLKNGGVVAVTNVHWAVLLFLLCAAAWLVVREAPFFAFVFPALIAWLTGWIMDRIMKKIGN